MKIDTGLHSKCVLQRTKDNVCDVTIQGTTDAAGDVHAIVTSDGKEVRLKGDKKVGSARGGSFKARLQGVKPGGPYRIELRVVDKVGDVIDSATATDVLVGDVWVLAGQSNMQGCGNAVDKHKGHKLVRGFYMDDKWGRAGDPLHCLGVAVDECHWTISGTTRPVNPKAPADDPKGVGPGVAFGVRMHEMTGVPQGLIAAAHGGTSMSQWDPKTHEETGESTLFSATVRRVKKNGGHVAGIVWYQGESDAHPDGAKKYTERMKELCAAFRKELGFKGGGTMPITIVQLGRVVSSGWRNNFQHWNSVQEQQRLLPRHVKKLATVPAIDLVLDDLIHIGGVDQQVLGVRLAEAMEHLREPKKGPQPPIEFDKVTGEKSPYNAFVNLKVKFKNVEGELVADGRPVGFSFADEALQDSIFRTDVEGDTVTLWTQLSAQALGAAMLHYGRGTDPVCNIKDKAGRSLPVLGPVAVGDRVALSEFIKSPQLSVPQPGQGKLDKLKYPKDRKGLGLKSRTFPSHFLDVHGDYAGVKLDDPMYWFVADFECDESMKLALRVGYDGPVKVWYDGRQVLHDPNGTNPAVEDEGAAKVDAKQGKHEVVIAFSSHGKAGWGVFLRLERLDVTKKQLEAGPGAYSMPTWV